MDLILTDYKKGQKLYFKFGGGVKCGNVLRINKKTITIIFSKDKEESKMTINGEIKGLNNWHTLILISKERYENLRYNCEIEKKWDEFRRDLFHISLTVIQKTDIMKLAKYDN